MDDIGEAYAGIKVGEHTELRKIKSKPFELSLIKSFFEETGKAPGADALKQAKNVLEMKAMFGGKQHKLNLRSAYHDGSIYYDLADSNWRAIKVSPSGCEILEQPPILFVRNKNTKEQVEPIFHGDLRLLINHVRIPNPDDQLLFLVYIVTSLIPMIPHPLLVFCGEKGAAKSTSMRMARSIIDPAFRDILIMPNSLQDLALVIDNNYMPCFDNMDGLSSDKSDLLCTASTGGGFSKRMLFTDDDETILSFKRCVSLNGINVVVTKPDLLDRSVIIELVRISERERKEEREVWEDFDKDKPYIIGGALKILSKAMQIYPTIKLEKLGRMADFTRWGYAVAEALGSGGERFLEVYLKNQNKSNEEAISSHPVASAIVTLMKDKNVWKGSVTELLTTLEHIAEVEKINTNSKLWPNAAQSLSRRIREVESNLKQVGITFDIRPTCDAKIITITKSEV